MNRNTLFNSCFLLLAAFLFMAATCSNPTTPSATKPDAPSTDFIKGCMDMSKKDPNKICTTEFEPVCACDGQTYSNACVAEKSGVVYYTKGKCGTCIDAKKINPNQPCTKEFRPVCGCNEVTYSNACLAEIAGVKTWKQGKCTKGGGTPAGCIDEKKINAKKICTKENKPVCGCDGKTYANKCEANKAGVTATAEGKCHECQDASLISNASIPLIHKPVCGCNGKTYGNQYAAKNAGITKFSEGPCKDNPAGNTDCIDPSKAKPDMGCPEIYRPVCACDGKTYSNACEAKRVGVTTWKPGKCE